MRFEATEENGRVTGRTLFEAHTRYLGFSGSSYSFTFVGKKATACIWSNIDEMGADLAGYIAVYVGEESVPVRRICLDRQEAEYTLYENDVEQQVTVTVMKYSEAAFGKCGIRYLEIDTDKLCPPPAHKARKMEIIGDSITCGYGVEAESEMVPFATATENPTRSYSLLTAGILDAEAQLVCWSGNGIISGYVEEDALRPSDHWLMPVVYRYTDISTSERIHGADESKWEEWDFSHFVPDIVLINLGTNDCSWCKDIAERKKSFQEDYGRFLKYVREHNPNSQILCMLGTMDQRVLHEVEAAVNAFREETRDGAVHFLALPPQDPADGYGADWHPCAYTHRMTAELVADEVRRIMNW